VFFGWRVVAGSFVSMMLVVGFFTYSFTLLVTPLREEFGASLEQVMLSLSIGTFMGLLTNPVAGVLIDRYSIRLLMTTGCLFVAAGLWAMSSATSMLMFYLTYGLTFSIGNGLAGAMPSGAVVSRWFVSNRGKALGISTIGTSVGGMVLPVLLALWIGDSDWRGALQNLALLTLFVVTPWVWLNIRGRPEDIGLLAEGAQASAVVGSTEGDSMSDIARRPEFWYIGLSVGLLMAVFAAMIANLSPYATQLGASELEASNLITALAVAGLIGKIFFGMAADRFSLKAGMWAAQGLVACACAILALEPDYAVMFIPAVLLGLATGGLLPVWNSMLAHVFGVNSYGRAMGIMGPLITLLIMPAYMIVGRLYDTTGSYTSGLLLSIAMLVVGALLLMPLRLGKAV